MQGKCGISDRTVYCLHLYFFGHHVPKTYRTQVISYLK